MTGVQTCALPIFDRVEIDETDNVTLTVKFPPAPRSGDIVFKGETLVEPYQIINGEKIDIVPCAEISCEVILSEKYEFFETETKTVKTGKSKVVSTNYMLGKIKLFGKTYKNNFGTFEIKEYSKEISNYFLPIRMTKTIAYETKTVEVEKDRKSVV